MNNQMNLSGYAMALAASAFWLSWFLMPESVSPDPAYVLTLVKQERTSVFYSCLTQVISTVFYMTSLFLLANIYRSDKKITLVGIILFGIGAMGMCADAFFHLVTYFMTDERIVIGDDILRVMSLLRKDGIAFLMPMLLSFFVGSLLLAIGLNREGTISKIPLFLNLAALVIIPITAIVSAKFITEGNIIALSILGLVATSHAFLGSELIISIHDQYEPDELCKAQTESVITKQS